MKKPIPGKVQIIWGVVLFVVPFFVPTHLDSYDPFVLDVVRWVGIGLVVYGFVKNSRESKG